MRRVIREYMVPLKFVSWINSEFHGVQIVRTTTGGGGVVNPNDYRVFLPMLRDIVPRDQNDDL